MDAPGLPGCFPRFFFSARSAARRCFLGGFRPGRSSELGGIEEFPLFRDPDRSAAASCSRRSATTASSAAIRSACVSISCACSRISASRGSSGGTSVTAPDHPRNHAQPPRQHHARRQNVTVHHAPQQQAQGPERLPIKLLYLGIRNITGRHIDGDGLVRERGERGTGTYGWKAAMNAFAVTFGDRVPV